MTKKGRLLVLAAALLAMAGVATMYYCNGGDCQWMPWHQEPEAWNK